MRFLINYFTGWGTSSVDPTESTPIRGRSNSIELSYSRDLEEKKKIIAKVIRERKQPLPITDNSSALTIQLFDKERQRITGKPLELTTQIIFGVARDTSWAWLTARGDDFTKGKTPEFFGLATTQMIGSLPLMLAALPIMLTLSGSPQFVPNRNLWLRTQFAFAFASWSSIPSWNAAQLFGMWLGDQLGLSEISAKYFSGAWTGTVEALWQGLIAPTILGRPISLQEIICNSPVGAVWQWAFSFVYRGNSTDEKNNVETAFAVAFAVALTTFAMALLNMSIDRCRAKESPESTPSVTTNSIFTPPSPATIAASLDDSIGRGFDQKIPALIL